MPKKNGISKTFSFDKETIEQIEALTKEYKLKQTALLEFLIQKEYNKVSRQ